MSIAFLYFFVFQKLQQRVDCKFARAGSHALSSECAELLCICRGFAVYKKSEAHHALGLVLAAARTCDAGNADSHLRAGTRLRRRAPFALPPARSQRRNARWFGAFTPNNFILASFAYVTKPMSSASDAPTTLTSVELSIPPVQDSAQQICSPLSLSRKISSSSLTAITS